MHNIHLLKFNVYISILQCTIGIFFITCNLHNYEVKFYNFIFLSFRQATVYTHSLYIFNIQCVVFTSDGRPAYNRLR
jgi:hypothetical protein